MERQAYPTMKREWLLVVPIVYSTALTAEELMDRKSFPLVRHHR